MAKMMPVEVSATVELRSYRPQRGDVLTFKLDEVPPLGSAHLIAEYLSEQYAPARVVLLDPSVDVVQVAEDDEAQI